jgi:hypothetical protein
VYTKESRAYREFRKKTGILLRCTEPPKIAFARGQFFTGFKVT